MNELSYPVKEAVRIGRISYINVSPVYYGLDRTLKPGWLHMVTEPPAVLNRKLENGGIVMSPVSSFAYAKNHKDWLILPDVSISSSGKVMSVLLASHYPLDGLDGKKIVFTEESATAANLIRYILSRQKIRPVIETRAVTTPQDLKDDSDAVLVIGDNALVHDWNGCFEYVFDLGELWDEMTQLPFVYAVWAVRKDFAKALPRVLVNLKQLFTESKKLGETHQDDIVTNASRKTGLAPDLCRDYFNHLNCDLTPRHLKGLKTFFDGLYSEGLVPEKVTLSMA